jgi:hypothetical protein
MKVAVYFNLHKNIFSVQSREKESYGRVIDHVESVVLEAPTFVVRQAGRKKVIEEKKKNVHAFVVGTIAQGVETLSKEEIVTYNPYKYTSFVKEDTREKVSSAEYSVIRFGVDGKPLISAYGA